MTVPIETNDPTVPQGIEPDPTPVSTEEIASATSAGEISGVQRPDVAALVIEPEDNVPCDAAPREVERFESPRDTKNWIRGRQDGIETFTAPDGRVWARAFAKGLEAEDAIVIFTGPRSRGLMPMRLVLAEFSYALQGAETRRRREERELRKRGYDV